MKLDVKVRLGRKSYVTSLAQHLAALHSVARLDLGRPRQRVQVVDNQATIQLHTHRVPSCKICSMDAAAPMRLRNLCHNSVADAQDRRVATAPEVNGMIAGGEEVRQVSTDPLGAQVGPVVSWKWKAERWPTSANALLEGSRDRPGNRRVGRRQALQLDRVEVGQGWPGLDAPQPHRRPRVHDNNKGYCRLLLATLSPCDASGEGLAVAVAHLDAAEGQVREARKVVRVHNAEHLVAWVPAEGCAVLGRRPDSKYQRMGPVHHDASFASFRQVVPG
mmetsp:Transcript_97124/g.258086  ORF Transcript_97124/g.258086 Transcript_97124/m.258086 type:complete len:276 (-) Transcript_97124:48-875(-)